MRNSTFLSTVCIIIVLSQCFQANAWLRQRRRWRSPVTITKTKAPTLKPTPPPLTFVAAPRNPSAIPLCPDQIDVNQIQQRTASGRNKRGVKRQVSVLLDIEMEHLRTGKHTPVNV